MNEIISSLNKRSARRFIYLPSATLDSQDMRESVQLHDISTSGMSFFSNALIQTNSPIAVIWENKAVGELHPYILIVRKIKLPHIGVYRYCYGARFTNLRQETRDNLENVIVKTSAEETEANRVLVEKITLDLFLDLIRQGRTYLMGLLAGNESSKLFHRFTRNIKLYERDAFKNMDEVSQVIQKLVMHTFHSQLLSITIPLTFTNSAQVADLQNVALDKLEAIASVIVESKKHKINPLVTESANRLLFSRIELLKIFVDTYKFDWSTLNKRKKSVQTVIDEYNQTFPKQKQ